MKTNLTKTEKYSYSIIVGGVLLILAFLFSCSARNTTKQEDKNDSIAKVTESVGNYINTIAKERNLPVDNLNDFKGMMVGTITNMTEEKKTIWAQKQVYIGLGFSLVASALEGVDSTPMEGFVPSKVDEILGLKELGLSSTVILTLGYRDEVDVLSTLKKVRRDNDNFFIRK